MLAHWTSRDPLGRAIHYRFPMRAISKCGENDNVDLITRERSIQEAFSRILIQATLTMIVSRESFRKKDRLLNFHIFKIKSI